MFETGLLRGKRVLITGGGTGLGLSMGKRFLELGASVAICGRREEVLKQAAAELEQSAPGRVAWLSHRLMRPGWTTAHRFGRSISTIRFIRVVETITPPAGAMAPPMSPVPEPRGTTGTRSRRQSRTTAATCSEDSGSTTASGAPL